MMRETDAMVGHRLRRGGYILPVNASPQLSKEQTQPQHSYCVISKAWSA